MQEVAPGIFRVTQAPNKPLINFSTNVFVIAGEGGIVFDAGFSKDSVSRALAGDIKRIEALMAKRGKACRITHVLPSHGHWDHFSGVENLRRHAGVGVLLTRKMVVNVTSKSNFRRAIKAESKMICNSGSAFERLWFKGFSRIMSEPVFRLFGGVDFISRPYELVEEGGFIETGQTSWQVLPLPGHCNDDIGLYNEKQGILLGGDTILRTITTWLGPPLSNLDAYMRSLESLLTLPHLTLILTAHGSPITDPLARIKAAIAHRRERTDKLVGIIREAGNKGIAVDPLVKACYPSLPIYRQTLTRGWIFTTLDFLVEKNVVAVSSLGDKKVFTSVC